MTPSSTSHDPITDPKAALAAAADDAIVDVREVPKPQRHQLIFARFDALAVGESFVLVNGHDPKHLRQEFDRDHPGTYDWEYLETGRGHAAGSPDGAWRIRISRRVDGQLPRQVGDTRALGAAPVSPDSGGAVWKLEPAQRQLDANVIQLAPDGRIEAHTGPDLDVLVHVQAGSGRLGTAAGDIELVEGALVWLPRRSYRAITAGADGLRYLSVHPRRPALTVGVAAG